MDFHDSAGTTEINLSTTKISTPLQTDYILMDHYFLIICLLVFMCLMAFVIFVTIACVRKCNSTTVRINGDIITIKSFTCQHQINVSEMRNRKSMSDRMKGEIMTKANEKIRKSKFAGQDDEYDAVGPSSPMNPVYSQIM